MFPNQIRCRFKTLVKRIALPVSSNCLKPVRYFTFMLAYTESSNNEKEPFSQLKLQMIHDSDYHKKKTIKVHSYTEFYLLSLHIC